MAWPLVPLSDLCSQHRAVASASDDLPYIAMDQVESNTGEIRLEAGSRSGNGDGTTFKFDARHVLYGKLRPYLNKVATPDFNGKCSTELVPLLPREGINRRFLAYVLRRDETIKTVMTAAVGARMPRASMDVLLAMPVPLPPLAEQQRIVDILDRAAAIQRLRRAAEEKAREIIPALFVDMFGDPATNPKGWRPGYLPDVLIGGFRNGLYLPKDAYARRDGGSGVEMVHMSDLFKGMVERGSLKRVIATEKQLADWSVCPDDLLLARRSLNFDGAARTTRISKSDEPLLFESSIIRLRPNRHVVNSEFLHYYFTDVSFRRSYVIPRITGATIYGINQKALSEMPVFIPPLQLQERFAAICKLLYDMSGLGTQASGVSERLLASAQTNLVGADD